MDYNDWDVGKNFPKGHENRECTCPAWWYQSDSAKDKPEWPECKKYGAFMDCKCFATKYKCWAKWDKENGR